MVHGRKPARRTAGHAPRDQAGDSTRRAGVISNPTFRRRACGSGPRGRHPRFRRTRSYPAGWLGGRQVGVQHAERRDGCTSPPAVSAARGSLPRSTTTPPSSGTNSRSAPSAGSATRVRPGGSPTRLHSCIRRRPTSDRSASSVLASPTFKGRNSVTGPRTLPTSNISSKLLRAIVMRGWTLLRRVSTHPPPVRRRRRPEILR